MSTDTFLKVDDAHVQKRMREVLKEIDKWRPTNASKFQSRRTANGCEERNYHAPSPYPALLRSQFANNMISEPRQTHTTFSFWLHTVDCSCSSRSLLAEAEQVTVTVKDKNDTLKAVTETTTVTLSRFVTSGSRARNNTLSFTQTQCNVDEKGGGHKASRNSTIEQSDTHIKTLKELDAALKAFLALALANPSL